jgi:hypothetical protein
MIVAYYGQPYILNIKRWIWPRQGIGIVGIWGLVGLSYVLTGSTEAAWMALGGFYTLLLWLDTLLAHGRGTPQRWGIHGLLAISAGVFPTVLEQVESHFAEEEFFVALQALALAIFWILLLIIYNRFHKTETPISSPGFSFDPRWLPIPLSLLAIIGLGLTVRSYQDSFFPSQVPTFEGISDEEPFICGEVIPDSQTFESSHIFEYMLKQVEANPYKGSPEYGMLALGSGDERWVNAFRESLLEEASQALFTGPANSVKSVQHEAALRIFYYSQMKKTYPDLFSIDEEDTLENWFAAINRRALTVEWIDWMYALAFAKIPEGPYENQENGSGLLAILMSEDLAPTDTQTKNKSYLDRGQRGWEVRFRNTDDAYIYQMEWITNALFQSLYTGESSLKHIKDSFDWLQLQALPDGAVLRYNHPSHKSIATSMYLGALLLGDPTYLWLAGRAVSSLEDNGGYLAAQPGAEQVLNQEGISPSVGSCLLYGDSGLPNQLGPLAPDKIVFRDGWSEDATYLLLNLRFTGWHRYKATNSIVLLYKDGYLITENLEGNPVSWLPTGRSLFRDKRIPRENLNGLLIERSGLSAVLYRLTSLGGPWAQDPPYYATVDRFETSDQLDISSTTIIDWHGWQHTRTVYFYHSGPIVVADHAEGPPGQQVALIWHTSGIEEQDQDQHILLRSGENPVEMILFHLSPGEIQIEKENKQSNDSLNRVLFKSTPAGQLDTVTIFMTGEWVGAEAELIQQTEGDILTINQNGRKIVVPLENESNSQ